VQVKLAKKLISLSDNHLNRINLKLTNGSDAVESAIKRARAASGKKTIIGFIGSHHGETVETIAASGKNFTGPFLGSSRDYFWLKADDSCINGLEKLLCRNHDIAGLIIEPVMVNAGVIVHPPERLQRLRQICSEHNIALIFDEVQTAVGWLGTIFGYQKLGLVPDMIALGKSLAPGFPLAALIMKKKYDVLHYGYDELTYGGNPVACAVALANLKILLKTNFNFSQKEALLENGLRQYGGHGCGFIWGVSCKSQKKAKIIYRTCFKKGLLLRLSGDEKTIIFKPPLVTTKAEINRAFNIFKTVWLEKY
jgi:acetylornithine/succinyldiaminopimelate/putrescine aminotransferase